MPDEVPNQCPFCEQTVASEAVASVGGTLCPHCDASVWFPRFRPSGKSVGYPVFALPAEASTTKEQVLRSIIDRLCEMALLPGRARLEVLSRIMAREGLDSTGLGKGVAIPHCSHPGVDRMVGCLTKIPSGVDFDALDGEPAYLVFLLVHPVDSPGSSSREVESIVRTLSDFDPFDVRASAVS